MSSVNRGRSRRALMGLTLALLSVIGIGMMLPFVWMIMVSLSPETRSLVTGSSIWDMLWPESIDWSNYARAWREIDMGLLYANTLLVAAATTFGQVLTSSLAAYAFARLRFPGRDGIFLTYLATMMVPSAVVVIPLYILMVKLRWLDTYWGLIVPAIFTAYGTFMLRQFFMSIPRELEDAARIDGCGLLRVYWHVALPLSKPALATLALFTFMGTWRDFFWPLIIMSSPEKFTLSLGLAKFVHQHGANWTLLMAGTVMATLPIVAVFLAMQRFFVEGIRLGAVKE